MTAAPPAAQLGLHRQPYRGIPALGVGFTAPEIRGILNTQLLKGWPRACAASSSVTPAHPPHQSLSGKAMGSASIFFFNYQTKKTKRKSHQNSQKPTQSDGTASVLGVPSKTFRVGPRGLGTPQSQPQL